MAEPEHVPDKPSWTCRACAGDWPCPPARTTLTKEYAETIPALGIYLSLCLHEAARDLPHADPADLYHRFLAWVSHPLDGATR